MLDSALFEGLRPDNTNGIFRVKSQASTSGLYDIYYTVYLENFPAVEAKYSTYSNGVEAFKVRLFDPADCVIVDGVTALIPAVCNLDCTDGNYSDGQPIQWLANIPDQNVSANDQTTYIFNGGVCEQNGGQVAVCDNLPFNDAGDFYSYDGINNTVTIDPTQIGPEDEGQWLVTFRVRRLVGGNIQTFLKSVCINVTYVAQ